MYSDAIAAPSGSRVVASNALRSAGLIDRDERMRDATDKHHAARKTTSKIRSHKPRLIDSIKGDSHGPGPGPSRSSTLAQRLGSSADPLSIRGAARPTPAGRVRRNAISLNGTRVEVKGRPMTAVRPLEVWREFVNRRYNPESRFLNLERMSEDEELGKARILPPGVPGANGREAAVIFKLAASLKPPVKTVSLANNNLHTCHFLSTLPHYLPDLANLSLENNNIKRFTDLDHINMNTDKTDKFKCLREFILLGNPLRTNDESHGRMDTYKNNMLRRFPTLEMLDKEPVTKIAFDGPSTSKAPHTGPRPIATTFPSQMMPAFVVGVDGALVSSFFSRFFPLFDTQRSALLDAYSDSATFSFQANTSIPARARIQGFQYSKEMPHQRNLEWSTWLGAGHGGSRNLSRIANAVEKMVKSMHVGREAVIGALEALPRTRHEMEGEGAGERFCVDGWPVQQGEMACLFLSIHGQFVELPTEGVRSFDRSFILALAPAGSRAKLAGWDVEILSDQLVVRNYSSHEAWKPGPLLVQAPDPSSSSSGPTATTGGAGTGAGGAPPLSVLQIPPVVQEALNPIPEPQRSLVLQVCQRTGLTVQFSVECLAGNGWELDKALANFEQVKSTLGREAFLTL